MSNSLYERMGGDLGVQNFWESIYEECFKDDEIQRLFENSPTSVLISHHVKLHRLMFGPKDQRPQADDVFNHMLVTHARLFRDLGLNEHHFDVIERCFVEGMENMQADQDVLDEVLLHVHPLREVFAYGAKLAEKEKGMTEEEKASLPAASAKTLETNQPSVLPTAPSLKVPDWLLEVLKMYSKESNVRAWTCAITTAFGEDDLDIADTLLSMPYMYHEVYAMVLLQLAFLPSSEHREKRRLVKMLKFPQGEDHHPVCLYLWNRMIASFVNVCRSMSVDQGQITKAHSRLHGCSKHFPDVALVKRGGFQAPHCLSGKTAHFRVVEASEGRSPEDGSVTSSDATGSLSVDKPKKKRDSEGGKSKKKCGSGLSLWGWLHHKGKAAHHGGRHMKQGAQ